MYKDIVEWVEAPPGSLRKRIPKLIRREPKTEAEKQQVMRSNYTWASKGDKFFYSRDFVDEINNLSHKKQHIFDGKQHWELNERDGTRYDRHGPNDLTDNNTVSTSTFIGTGTEEDAQCRRAGRGALAARRFHR